MMDRAILLTRKVAFVCRSRWWTQLSAVRAENPARDRGRGIFGSEMILRKRLRQCDSFLLLVQRGLE
jgi:hypothetical protein